MKSSQDVAEEASRQLRTWIHDANNSLFVSKGFIEEVMEELAEAGKGGPDDLNTCFEQIQEMVETSFKHLKRLEVTLHEMQTFARVGLLELTK